MIPRLRPYAHLPHNPYDSHLRRSTPTLFVEWCSVGYDCYDLRCRSDLRFDLGADLFQMTCWRYPRCCCCCDGTFHVGVDCVPIVPRCWLFVTYTVDLRCSISFVQYARSVTRFWLFSTTGLILYLTWFLRCSILIWTLWFVIPLVIYVTLIDLLFVTLHVLCCYIPPISVRWALPISPTLICHTTPAYLTTPTLPPADYTPHVVVCSTPVPTRTTTPPATVISHPRSIYCEFPVGCWCWLLLVLMCDWYGPIGVLLLYIYYSVPSTILNTVLVIPGDRYEIPIVGEFCYCWSPRYYDSTIRWVIVRFYGLIPFVVDNLLCWHLLTWCIWYCCTTYSLLQYFIIRYSCPPYTYLTSTCIYLHCDLHIWWIIPIVITIDPGWLLLPFLPTLHCCCSVLILIVLLFRWYCVCGERPRCSNLPHSWLRFLLRFCDLKFCWSVNLPVTFCSVVVTFVCSPRCYDSRYYVRLWWCRPIYPRCLRCSLQIRYHLVSIRYITVHSTLTYLLIVDCWPHCWFRYCWSVLRYSPIVVDCCWWARYDVVYSFWRGRWLHSNLYLRFDYPLLSHIPLRWYIVPFCCWLLIYIVDCCWPQLFDPDLLRYIHWLITILVDDTTHSVIVIVTGGISIYLRYNFTLRWIYSTIATYSVVWHLVIRCSPLWFWPHWLRFWWPHLITGVHYILLIRHWLLRWLVVFIPNCCGIQWWWLFIDTIPMSIGYSDGRIGRYSGDTVYSRYSIDLRRLVIHWWRDVGIHYSLLMNVCLTWLIRLTQFVVDDIVVWPLPLLFDISDVPIVLIFETWHYLSGIVWSPTVLYSLSVTIVGIDR